MEGWQQTRDSALEERLKGMFHQVWSKPYRPAGTSAAEQLELYAAFDPVWNQVMRDTYLPELRFPYHMSEAMIRPRGSTVFINRQCSYLPTAQHAHEFYELGICLRGSCRHFIQQTVLTMRAGDMVLIPPGTRHFPVMLDESCSWYDLGFSAERLPQVLPHLWGQEHPLIQFLMQTREAPSVQAHALLHESPETLSRALRPLVEERPDFDDALSLKCVELQVERFVMTLLRSKLELVRDDPAQLETDNGMLNYIRSRFKTVTRKELAEHFSYSERQITRILYKQTGKSLTDYLCDVRLDYVTDMLAHTLVPVYEIVEAAGYQNNNFFYKLFRERYGLTPSEFRAQSQRR